jgi:hypothetical protein
MAAGASMMHAGAERRKQGVWELALGSGGARQDGRVCYHGRDFVPCGGKEER